MQSETVKAAGNKSTSTTRTRARFIILALLAVGTMINYLDRTVLGIAAPTLTKDLGLTAAVMGLVFSAFSWTYAAAQIPGGVFLDRYGSKLTYTLALAFWSAFTALQGVATGLYSLLFYRFGLGLAPSPLLPDQQPHRRQLVPAAGTSPRHQHLYGGRISRPCRLRPGPFLDVGQLWLAIHVHCGRHRRYLVLVCLLVGI